MNALSVHATVGQPMASAGSASIGSISGSLRGSSNSSSPDNDVAEGDYRILDVAQAPERPGMLRLRLAHAARPQAVGDVWLELVEVLPELRRRGYGRSALRWVVARAEGQGTGTLLQVHRVNEAARRLYLSEGFTDAGGTPTHHVLRKAPRGPASR